MSKITSFPKSNSTGNRSRAVVLLSGGMDSCVCAALAARDHQTAAVWTHRDGAWVLVFCQETGDTKAPSTADSPKPGFRPGFPNPKITSDPPPSAIEKQ